jgi:antitoxin component YwqK of YwqJK toxin-antitoxin module
MKKVNNKDTLYLVGYDDNHNLKIVEGIVETALNEKYADPEIRIKTEIFLYYNNFVGAPIVDANGKVVGVINRAYRLNKNKHGSIIADDKLVEGAHFEYYINGTSIRAILGKDYGKKGEI